SELDAVAEEDLRVAFPDYRGDAPALERLRRVLARAAAAEVAIDHQDLRALILRLVERMRGIAAIVGKDVAFETLERDGFQVALRNDSIGVDVMSTQGNGPSRRVLDSAGAHAVTSMPAMCSRTSTTSPAMAAAATMAGDTSSVRPVGLPWRPLKL